MQILTNAFSSFVNLERVTFDHCNRFIGFNQLAGDFGGSCAEDILIYDDVNILPMLVQALSQANTRVEDLEIGCQYEVPKPRHYAAAEHGSWAMERRLRSRALIAAFSRPDILAHAYQVLSQIRILRIGDIDVKDNRHDLLRLAATIKEMTTHSPKLQRIDIGVCTPCPSCKLLSIEDLFELQNAHHLQQVVLGRLEITYHQNLILFLSHHARTLSYVVLDDVKLTDEKYVNIFLPNVRTTREESND